MSPARNGANLLKLVFYHASAKFGTASILKMRMLPLTLLEQQSPDSSAS